MRILFLFLICTLNLSCQINSSNDKNLNPRLEIDQLQGPNFSMRESLNYVSDCYTLTVKKQTIYLKSNFILTKVTDDQANFTLVTKEYLENCNESILETKMSGFGILKMNNKLLEANLNEAKIKPLTLEAAQNLNQSNACEVNNWQLSEYSDVLYSSCVGSNKDGDIYMNSTDEKLTLYMCEHNEPLTTRCEQIQLKKSLKK